MSYVIIEPLYGLAFVKELRDNVFEYTGQAHEARVYSSRLEAEKQLTRITSLDHSSFVSNPLSAVTRWCSDCLTNPDYLAGGIANNAAEETIKEALQAGLVTNEEASELVAKFGLGD